MEENMEEKVDDDLIVQIEDPSTAKHSSNPQKARLTGLSIEGLKSNISKKKLESKIDKYNREYNRLKKLAIEVNKERLNATDSEYEEVKASISKYNAQAKKMAEIAVQILVFDDDIKKIGMGKGDVARGIKVPPFLVNGFKRLTRAGRYKVEEERKAALEKKALEDDMYNRIVDIAKEAIDQDPRGTIDSDKLLNTLNTNNIFAEVKNSVLNNQQEESTEKEINPENADDKINIRKGKETISPADMVTELMPGDESKDDVSKKREQVDEGIRRVYARRNNDKHGEFDLFKAIKTMSKYRIVVQNDEGKKSEPTLVETVIRPFDNSRIGFSYNDERFAEKVGAKKSSVSETFQEALDFCTLAGAWKAVVSSSALPNRNDAFSDDKVQMFNYVVEGIRSGKERKSLIEEINSNNNFSTAEKDVMTRCLAKREYDVFAHAIESFENINQDFADYLVSTNENVQIDEKTKIQEVDEGISRKAIAKYNLKGKNTEKVEESKEDVVEENNNVDKLSELQLELADCIKNRPSSDDPEKLAEYNQNISDLINKINEIARNGLDKSEEPKEVSSQDEVVHVEEVQPSEEVEENGRDQLDLWEAKNWAEKMSNPDSEEAKDVMLHGRFSDYDVEQMHRVANAALDKEAEENRMRVSSERSAQTRNDVQKKREDIVNRAKAFVLSEMFGEVDYDKALEDISRDDGVDVFKDEIERRRVIDPNGFVWCVDSFVKRMADSAQGMESSVGYNERVCSMAVNDLLNGTSEYDAARIINDMRINQKKIVNENTQETQVVPEISTNTADASEETNVEWEQIMRDPDEEKQVISQVVDTDNKDDESEVSTVVDEPEGKITEGSASETVADEVDPEHKDYYEWWTGILPTLDDPVYQQASELNLARYEADRKADELNHDIEKRNFEENRQVKVEKDKAIRDEHFSEILESGMAEEILAMKGFTVGKEPDDPTAIEILSNVKQNNEDIYNKWIEEYRDYKRQQIESSESQEIGIKK